MNNCELIFEDMLSFIPKQYISDFKKRYNELCKNNYTENVMLIVLLYNITELLYVDMPNIYANICRQRGKDMAGSFSNKRDLIGYTSAEFARERYNISSEIYKEILHFEDINYTSNLKTEVKRILNMLG